MDATELDIQLQKLDVSFELKLDEWEITPGKQSEHSHRREAMLSFVGSVRQISPYFLELISAPTNESRAYYAHLSLGFGAGWNHYGSGTPSDHEAFIGSLEVTKLTRPMVDGSTLAFSLYIVLPYDDLATMLAVRDERTLVKLSFWGEGGKAYGARLSGGDLHLKVRTISFGCMPPNV